MLLNTLTGSLAAKLALGIAVAAASVTAAGAAGVLPDPAQQAVASVVSATTPFALPEDTDATDLVDDDLVGDDLAPTTTTTTTTTVAGAGDDEGESDEEGIDGGAGDRAVNHGACVSAAARTKSEPGTHGKTVSSVARSDCGKAEITSSPSTTMLSTTTTTTLLTDEQRSANAGPGSANSGKGKGGKGGPGTSGRSPGRG